MRIPAHTFLPGSGVAQRATQLARAGVRPLFPVGLPAAPANVRATLPGPMAARPNAGATIPQFYHVPAAAASNLSVREPLRLDIEGAPSFTIEEGRNGSTVIRMRRKTQFMATVQDSDLSELQGMGRAMLTLFENMSQGPYNERILRLLHHPYGYDLSWAKGNPVFKARKVPSLAFGHKINAVKGVRGAVPTLNVVNTQSGVLARSWSFTMQRDSGGVTLVFANSAPYSWFLAHGTVLMQPHGPWNYVPVKYLSEFNSAMRAVVYRARARARALELEAMTAQHFGPGGIYGPKAGAGIGADSLGAGS